MVTCPIASEMPVGSLSHDFHINLLRSTTKIIILQQNIAQKFCEMPASLETLRRLCSP